MPVPANINSFLGNSRVVEILRRALAQDRLPHAMIFAGPAGVGKRTLALRLAQLLNCLSLNGDDACGACLSCRKILASAHPDVWVLEPDGAYIKIEQVRALIGEIAFQPFEGKYRVVILDAADQMRQETANCLLKTLEEPPSRSFIVLVTTNPYALLATIRSRCRMLQFGGIPTYEIELYLMTNGGRKPEEARLAAAFCDGSLGAALSFDVDRFRELRKQALHFLELVLGHRGFTEASQLAATLAKDKEGFQIWMETVQALLRDIYYSQVAPHRVVQLDVADQLKALALSVSAHAVISGIEAIKKLRTSLLHNANRQIALEALYLSFWSRNVSCQL